MLALLGTLCGRGPRQYGISWDLPWKSESHRLMLRSLRVRLLVPSDRSSAVSRCAVELSPKGTVGERGGKKAEPSCLSTVRDAETIKQSRCDPAISEAEL